jgi:hypothetical protein
MPLDLAEPTWPAIPAMIASAPVSNISMEIPKMILDKLKKEHKFAKAMKSDDAEVPVWLWDKAVCVTEVSIDEKQALSVLRVFCLGQYRQKSWRQIQQYPGAKFGRIHHPLGMYGKWRDNDRMDKEERSRLWQEAQTQILGRESKGWLARARKGGD